MSAESDSRLSVAELEQRTDKAVLDRLLQEPGLWSLDELARELSTIPDTEDGLGRLQAAGFVHRIGNFAFASRAAKSATAIFAE